MQRQFADRLRQYAKEWWHINQPRGILFRPGAQVIWDYATLVPAASCGCALAATLRKLLSRLLPRTSC